MEDRRTWLIAILVAAVGLHAAAFLLYAPGDIYFFVREWYRHLLLHGFSEPVGNYAPPYMYLLWALTLLDGLLWQIVLIKLLSIAGACWTAYAVSRILQSLGSRRELSLLVLALPSIILDSSLLGQADTFWIAPCLLATTASIDRKYAKVAFWSGLAFAVKAQSAFFAPFVIYLFVHERVSWRIWAVAPCTFVAAWTPAWLLGWPISYLTTLYLGQFEWVNTAGDYFVGSSASIWTTAGFIAPQFVFNQRWFGVPLVLAGIVIYAVVASRERDLPEPGPRLIASLVDSGNRRKIHLNLFRGRYRKRFCAEPRRVHK